VAVLNFVESGVHKPRKIYFSQIAKFGEDIFKKYTVIPYGR